MNNSAIIDFRYYVYVLINSLDNKIFYVGKGTGDRVDRHIKLANSGSTLYVHKKIRKILGNNGTVIPEIVFKTDLESKALEKEVELIAFYGRKNLTNLTDGGEGSSGFKHSVASLRKQSLIKLGKKLSKESIAKRQETRKLKNIPAWNKGKKMPPEFCIKVSKGGLGKVPWNKGITLPDAMRKNISKALMGHKVSDRSLDTFLKMAKKPKTEEHKLKLSVSNSGRVLSKERRLQMSLVRIGSKHSQETKDKIGLGNKGKVVSLETRQKMSKSKLGKPRIKK